MPPIPRRDPKTITQLGRTRVDEYAWMKAPNWREVMRDPSQLPPELRAHLEAENAYTAALMAGTEPLQARLFEEMKGRIKEDDATIPEPDGPFEYYSRYELGAQHPRFVRRPRGADGPETVLLDAEAESRGKAYYRVSATDYAPDHTLFAWAEDEQGAGFYRLRVKEIATGQALGAPMESASGDFVFSPDGAFIFWVWQDESARPSRLYRRPARGGEDVLVYEEADEGFFLNVDVTGSRAFVVIATGDHETSEVRLIPGGAPETPPILVEPRTPGLRYEVEHWDDRLVILTNADGAVDFKLMWADPAAPGRAGWREWTPHRPGRFIVGMTALASHFVRLERANANTRIVVTARADFAEHEIAQDEDAYALSIAPRAEFGATLIRFIYESPTTPKQWFDYDPATRTRTVRKIQEVPSGHDPKKYVTRRLTATAADGAEIPITVLMRAGLPLDGSAPVMLYGYGSYGIPMEPSFSIRSLSLVDRGWIWATAHVRGGSEKGWNWFLEGRKEKKVNTFTDFIAAAERLAALGYGRSGRMVAYGGSAGGLLVGAVVNLRPDLWAGAIAAVPFVDALNTMSDAELPLTPPEWPEWGNPLEDPAAYDTIASYSPYDNVADRRYPPILATSGVTDSRVTYWEPTKWIARLRERAPNGGPYLLRMNLEAGHGGASGRFEYLKEIALDYAFALKAMGDADAGGAFG